MELSKPYSILENREIDHVHIERFDSIKRRDLQILTIRKITPLLQTWCGKRGTSYKSKVRNRRFVYYSIWSSYSLDVRISMARGESFRDYLSFFEAVVALGYDAYTTHASSHDIVYKFKVEDNGVLIDLSILLEVPKKEVKCVAKKVVRTTTVTEWECN